MLCNFGPNKDFDFCRRNRGVRCGKCPGPGTEILTFSEETYAVLTELAEFEGRTVAEALTKFIEGLATDLTAYVERRREEVEEAAGTGFLPDYKP